jgi:tetratricopeptide (TPR) repeat protein
MQYHCVQCNEVFTPPAGEDKPRCPKCMRQHGLRPVEARKSEALGSRRSARLPVLAGLLLLAAGLGYFGYRQLHKHEPGKPPLRPLDLEDLRTDVRTLAGVDAGELALLLESDARVRTFAEQASKGVSGADAQAQAVCAALAARKQKLAYVDWPRVEPREGAPLTASGTAAALEKDGARRQLYPLEVSSLAVAALRSLGVPALLAEVYRFPNERSALDPSGRLGYFAVFVPSSEQAPNVGKVFDAYAGRKPQPSAADYDVLNDAQAVGAALALRALQRFDNSGDAKAGLADSDAAVKLVPSSASVRGVRAALLLATGGIEAGSRELDAAAQLKNDPARRNNLAVLALVSGDPDLAAKQVSGALAELPDYALARLTLASVHLMQGERDLARSEIEKAERLEPDLALLPQVWAQLYASENDLDQAAAKAQEAVRRRPRDPQARIVLARIDRAAGHYDDMRAQAREILALVPVDERERMQGALREMLGPTAFDDAAPAAQAPSSADSLSLSRDADKVGLGPGADVDVPRPSEPGALQLQPGASRLRLGGGDSKLKLDLHP